MTRDLRERGWRSAPGRAGGKDVLEGRFHKDTLTTFGVGPPPAPVCYTRHPGTSGLLGTSQDPETEAGTAPRRDLPEPRAGQPLPSATKRGLSPGPVPSSVCSGQWAAAPLTWDASSGPESEALLQ